MATVVPINVTTAQGYQDVFEKAFDLPTNAALTEALSANTTAASTADGKAVAAQADATNAKTETDRLKQTKPIASVQTLSDAVTLAGVSLNANEFVQTGENVSGSGKGSNIYQKLDAGSAGARPAARQGIIIHVGADGLYLKAIDPKDGRYSGEQLGLTATSTASEIQAVLALEVPLRLDSALVQSGVSLSGKSVDIELTGNIVIDYSTTPAGFSPFHISVPFLNSQVVSALSNVDYNFGGGNTTVTRLTVSDASAYDVFDPVKIISQDQIAWLDPAQAQKMGSSHIVGAIDVGSNYLYLLDTVYHAFATTIKVAKYDVSKKINITGNAVFTKSGTMTGNALNPMIMIKGAYLPRVSGIEADGTYGEFVSFRGCYGAKSRDITASNLITDTTNEQYGYAVVERSCSYGDHENITGFNVRHVYTNGAGFNPTAGDYASYGCNEYSVRRNVKGVNCSGSADDTHPESYHCVSYSSTSYYPQLSLDGTFFGVQLRGKSDLAINPTIYGGQGAVIRGEYAQDGACDGCEIIGLNYYPKAGERVASPVLVNGVSGGKVTGAKVKNTSINGCLPSVAIVSAVYAEVEVENTNVTGSLTLSSSKPFYRAQSSKLTISGGSTDFGSSNQSNLRFAILIGDDTEFKCKNHEIKTNGASFAALVDFSNDDGNAFLSNITTSAAPSLSFGTANRGAAATYNASYKVNDGLGGRSSVITMSRGVSFALDDTYRTQEQTADEITVIANCTGTAGTINITDINAGRMVGQRMKIINNPASTKTLRLPKSLNIGVSADTDLLAGDGKLLTWSGSLWVG